MIALSNRPCARGAVISHMTLSAPADSPAMVTLSGSPPKAVMFSSIQRSAAI